MNTAPLRNILQLNSELIAFTSPRFIINLHYIVFLITFITKSCMKIIKVHICALLQSLYALWSYCFIVVFSSLTNFMTFSLFTSVIAVNNVRSIKGNAVDKRTQCLHKHKQGYEMAINTKAHIHIAGVLHTHMQRI